MNHYSEFWFIISLNLKTEIKYNTMKSSFFNKFFFILFITVVFASCDLFNNDDDPPAPTDEYLISFEKHKSYPITVIKPLLENFAPLYPEFQEIIDEVEHGITVYKISYITSFKGEDIIASGLVSVPTTNNISFPVMSFQNGTNTLHSEAPTVSPDSQFYLLLEFIASTGFVISVPDYLGFGSTDHMFHPYLDKESTIQPVTDMLLAVKELVNNYLEIEISNDLYINGYSQGGWATMQLQKEIEEKYNSEFNLKASACGAGPYDLNYINNYVLELDEYPMPYFLGYIYNSHIQLGNITTPTSEVFNSPYDERIPTLYDGTKSGEEINELLTTKIADLFTTNYIENSTTDEQFSSIISSMNENSIGAWNTSTPTLILHGMEDDYVPPLVSFNLYQDFLSKGVNPANISYVPIPGVGHQSGIIPAESIAIKWFIQLKNGE